MKKRLLCIFSHPDDESFGPAGTIRHVAGQIDGEVRIVCATRGEAGSIGISKQYAAPDLARVRQAEMFAACRILEAEPVFLGFPDGHVPEVDSDLMLDLLVEEVRAFRPQVILTFHPNGISGHPDHIAMSRHARAAFDAAADPSFVTSLSGKSGVARPAWSVDRLFYYGITRTRAGIIEHFRRLETMDDDEADLELDVSASVSRKHAACLAHGTQADFIHRLEAALGDVDTFWSVEHLALGAWRGEKPQKPLSGMF